MSWLSALGGAASALLAKGSGLPNLPNFGLVERDSSHDALSSIWTLHVGIKRDDSSTVSVFVFDSAQPGYGSRHQGADRKSLLPLARNMLKKLRSLRHPDIVKFVDASETDTAVYIVTEQVKSLPAKLREMESQGKLSTAGADEWKVWGLCRVVSALKFINGPGASTHGNIRPASIFTTPSGEWKLGGFEVLSSPKDPQPVLYAQGSLLPESSTYSSPETQKNGFSALRDLDPACHDAFQLHLLIQSLFNPNLPLPLATATSPPAKGAIPAPVYALARRLAMPNPRSRLKAEAFYDLGMATTSSDGNSGFFKKNRLVEVCEGLDGFALASQGERAALVRNIKEMSESLPSEFLQFKILPALVSSFDHSSDGPTLLPLAVSISSSLTQTEFTSVLTPPLIKLWTSPDRAIRLSLLELLPQFIDRLEKGTVCDKVWPNLVTGFGDTVPVIREATLKSVLLLAPKLSERILNNDLLRHLAKTQVDAEPGIRTNTCILLGRLSKHLSVVMCRKVLIPAFSRSLRDPFTPARLAGLMALMATGDLYEKEDVAGRVIPAVSTVLIDKEKTVRDQAFKALDMFLDKVKKAVSEMPDSAEAVSDGPTAGGTNAISSDPGIAMSAAGAAGALAGWAFSSVGRKLTTSELASSIETTKGTSSQPVGPPTVANGVHTSTGGPLQQATKTQMSPTDTLSTSRSISSWDVASLPTSDHRGSDERLPGDWAGDLMDVDADADDWSTFETGPPPHDPSFVPLPSTFSPHGTPTTRHTPTVAASNHGVNKIKAKPKVTGSSTGGALKLGGGMKKSTSGGVGSSLVATLEAEAEFGGDSWGGTGGDASEDWGAVDVTTPPVVADTWGGFDDSRTSQSSVTIKKEDKVAQMAKMREERRAKMAALKAKKATA